ncbi:unnamed protein product [Rhizophagus irregularis]|nr:unnamed protein product [Rhizophagus irregularis]
MKNYKSYSYRRNSSPSSQPSRDRNQISRSTRDSSPPFRPSKIGQDPKETLHLLPDSQKIGAKFQEAEFHKAEAKLQEAHEIEAKKKEETIMKVDDMKEEIIDIGVEKRAGIMKEVREGQAYNQDQTATKHRLRIRLSLSPKPLEYTKRFRKNMKPMDYRYKKSFRDEVVQILKGLDSSLSIDLFNYKKKWTEIERNVL